MTARHPFLDLGSKSIAKDKVYFTGRTLTSQRKEYESLKLKSPLIKGAMKIPLLKHTTGVFLKPIIHI